MNRPPYGDIFRRNSQFYKMFEVTSQILPNKTVKVSPGSYTRNGNEIVEFVGANTTDIAKPTTGAKWVLVSLNNLNVLVVTSGEASSTSPVVPTLLENHLPLALIYVKSTDDIITQDMIYDIRPYFGIYFETVPKVTVSDFNNYTVQLISDIDAKLATKANMEGTDEATFYLNREESGSTTPMSSDAYIKVNRGSATDVSIRWNDTLGKWQYTNDGIDYRDFGYVWETALSSISAFGSVKLSCEPVVASEPIVVGTNDTRLFNSATEKLDLLTAVNTTIPALITTLQTTDTALGLRTFATETEKNDILTAVNTTIPTAITALQSVVATHVVTTDTRLFASEAEKLAVLAAVNTVMPSMIINYSNLSTTLASKLAAVDEAETITSVWTFSPTIPHAPFILGPNAVDRLVTGLNAEKLNGKSDTDFVPVDGDITSFVLKDIELSADRYRIEIRSGNLVWNKITD